jgi:hypothetical protein
MTKSNATRIAAILAAMAASAVLFAMYVANGVVYGSLVGLKNREHDLHVASARGKTALAVALCLQIVVIVTTAFSLPRQNLQLPARLVIGGAVSVLGTVVTFALFLQIIRIFRL